VEEIKPPPPPPPDNLPPPPKSLPPPPDFMPPPEVNITSNQDSTNTITTTTDAPPVREVRIEPAPAPAPPPRQVTAVRAVVDATNPGCRPEFPPAAQRANATGTSKIQFTVDAQGKVTKAEVLQPSGPTREHRLLDRAAAEALQQCPIKPGMDETGRPIGTTTIVEYVWRLE